MGKPRGRYTQQELRDALKRVRRGETHALVAATSPVSLRALFKKEKQLRETGALETKRRGTKPAIPDSIEQDIVEWIAAMQRAGLPPTRQEIIRRANEIKRRIEAKTTRSSDSAKPLTSGWFKRFRGRHPELADRRAQAIARVRNQVDAAVVETLFGTLVKLAVEHKIGPSRAFNMDETSFAPDGSTKSVVAMRGSPNVWTKEMKASFHLTVVAAVSAAGFAVAPELIVPGKRILKTDLSALYIPNACLTGAPKGFSNQDVFKQWLRHFQRELIRNNIEFPVILVLDNSSTHITPEAVDVCIDMGIFLVALPANSTHLFQPLDVAVFRSFKGEIRQALERLLVTTDAYTITKRDAIEIACDAYKKTVIDCPTNAINGFATTGVFPPNLVQLKKRLQLSSSGGVRGDRGTAAWLKRKQSEVRDEVLTLPPDTGAGSKKAV
ncbi:hypothetical protein ATCC90586_011059 [Pythium insidiosum]|nr:hypothetical protein ATCC90586_011059 [Pythium insidiosum]